MTRELLPHPGEANHTGLEGRFSIEFGCATAARDGALGLAQVNDQQVLREDVQSLIPQA